MKKSILALVAGALVLGGAVSAKAQVYSVNAVGFVNLPIPAGFSMIASPLSGATNKLSKLFASGVPDFTTIYKWTGSGFATPSVSFEGVWDQDLTVVPGEGLFINAPRAFTNTFVGEVLTGNLVIPLPAGFSMVSSMVPQSGGVDALGLIASSLQDFDTIYLFNSTSQQYQTPYVFFEGSWSPSTPNIKVGESFWIYKNNSGSWQRNFSVN